MPQLFTNNARALLASGITDSATAMTVEASKADLFPTANADSGSVPSANNWFKATLQDSAGNVEIVYVRTRTAGSGVFSNVIRGQEGTTARAFSAGTVVGLRITAADVEGSIAAALNSMQVTGNQTVEGTKTFNGPIIANGGVQGNVSGNAGTVTNGVYTTGDQTIGGVKTFSGLINANANISISGPAPLITLVEADQASPAGRRRIVQDGNQFTVRRNTAAAGDFSTEVHDITSDASGNFTANGNITANGQFTGNGAGLTNVNATNVTGTAGQLGYSVNSNIGFGGRGGPEVTGHGGGAAAMMSFHRPGHFAVNFGLDGNDIAVGGWSFGNVSWRILHQGNWRGIIGAANVGEVGTYAFMRSMDGISRAPGATIAGSSLEFSNAAGTIAGHLGAGTWRCMGFTGASGTTTTSLWLRIS